MNAEQEKLHVTLFSRRQKDILRSANTTHRSMACSQEYSRPPNKKDGSLHSTECLQVNWLCLQTVACAVVSHWRMEDYWGRAKGPVTDVPLRPSRTALWWRPKCSFWSSGAKDLSPGQQCCADSHFTWTSLKVQFIQNKMNIFTPIIRHTVSTENWSHLVHFQLIF